MPRKDPFAYKWWVLILCVFIQLYFATTYVNGISALINPLIDEFGWSYTLVSLAFTVRGFESGILAPVVGFFVDKLSPRKMLVAGAISGAIGFLLFSQVHSIVTFLLAVLFIGISLSLSSGVVVMAAVASWFKTRTSLAMGILTTGTGIGGLLMPVVIWLIDGLSWRTALIIFGLGSLIICLPLCFLVKNPPKEIAAESSPKPVVNSKTEPTESPFKQVLKERNFWLLSFAVLLTGFSNSAVAAHQIPYLVSTGMTRQTAGYIVVIFSLASIAGRLFAGWLGDVISKKNVYLLVTAFLITGMVIFAYSTSVAQAVPAVIILGIGLGGVIPLRPALQIEFFGRKAFATIQGLLMISITAGSMLSPLFAGWIFDHYSSYRPAWLILSALALIAIPIILSFSKKSTRQDQQTVQEITPS